MSAFSETLMAKYKSKLPKDYIAAIADLAENRTSRRFLNDSDVHAQLLIECMIGGASADDAINIYSGELKKSCYLDILKATKGNVRILVDNFQAAQSVINELDLSQNDRIKILPVAEKASNHFYTVGNHSFRYELDHNLATAVANFYEPETAEKLNLLFDNMWTLAEAKGHKVAQAAA
jgi:hypothetical protein